MADPTAGVITPREEDPKSQNGDNKKEDLSSDPELFSCLLQPSPRDSDPNYIGIRRLLLYRKAEAGVLRRKDWRCNGRGYVAYRNYINRPKNGDSLQTPSAPSTPGNSFSSTQFSHQVNLLVDASVDDGCQLQVHYHHSLTQTAGDVRSFSQAMSHRTSFSSSTSDIEFPRKKGEPAYSFVGMHCIFDQCKAMVTVIKFGHMSSDLLAYGAADGSLTVCSVSMPPSILKQLTGHTKDVTDFDFSANNQYIASASIDKTVRVWDISKGICMRVIYGVSSQLCIRFHPVNNNFLSVGNANKEIMVFNFSTGRTINKSVFDSEVTAMDHDHTGHLIFCGDAQVQGYLTLRCALKLAPRLHSIRASFCPLLSLEKGEFIVAGSEDASVYFYDLTRPRHTCVNKLQ
ncbi:transducin/WD40 repeat-like superfamily protein, partial [Striga asiatica]